MLTGKLEQFVEKSRLKKQKQNFIIEQIVVQFPALRKVLGDVRNITIEKANHGYYKLRNSTSK